MAISHAKPILCIVSLYIKSRKQGNSVLGYKRGFFPAFRGRQHDIGNKISGQVWCMVKFLFFFVKFW